ncbi:hypothetical protein HOLleu_14310 [Holothuria leucospilota]|uniref:Uncharacterized protein n=1 Tax=Holothuria leucospilota TaxID=206669 RepID=A0A9Q1C7D3_HOLLE|nr:hypothetical protein HOLleu_14310 [Holothuria leucospilota]
MNYAFQVSQSSYGTTEESAFKKRWMYRPKSNQFRSNVRSQPKRVTPNLQQEEPWEPLCGWSCPEEINVDLIDIEGWTKKSQNNKKGAEHTLVEKFLYSVFVTCPSIYDFDEFKEASLIATVPSPHHEVVDAGPRVSEVPQADLEPASIANQQKRSKSEKIDIESLHSASTVSSKSHSSGELQNYEKGTQVDERECDALADGQRNEELENERSTVEEDDSKDAEEKSQVTKTYSNVKSKSASSVRQLDRLKAERRISSAQSEPKGAGGDGVKQSALRKNSSKKSVAKKVTLNPAPIEISYTEGGLFEVTSPTRLDEDTPPQENHENRIEEGESETSHRISLRTPDRKAWEQSLTKQLGFELPVLSSLSVGDLLSSTPRLEQFLDNTDSKLTFIQTLYDKNSVQPDSVSVEKSVNENNSQDQNVSFSNLPSLKRDGSPHNLVSSPGAERRIIKQASAIGQDNASQVIVPSVNSSNRQSPSSNHDNSGSHLEGGRRGSKGDTSEHKLTQKKRVAKSATSQTDSLRNRQVVRKMPSAKQQRGPPGFRPPSNKTPLQRAMENAHKKIYGEHHYLFSQQNIQNGQHPLTNPTLHPFHRPSNTHSLSLSHRRSIVCNHCTKLQLEDYGPFQLAPLHPLSEPLHPIGGDSNDGPESAKLVARLSSSPSNQTIDPSVQILSKVESRNTQLQKSYSELFRLARQKKLQLRKGGDKFYTLSDFQAPLEKTNVLRTQSMTGKRESQPEMKLLLKHQNNGIVNDLQEWFSIVRWLLVTYDEV